jgi:hypothetical protein
MNLAEAKTTGKPKQPLVWPLFPVDKAPWLVLMGLGLTLPPAASPARSSAGSIAVGIPSTAPWPKWISNDTNTTMTELYSEARRRERREAGSAGETRTIGPRAAGGDL